MSGLWFAAGILMAMGVVAISIGFGVWLADWTWKR